MMILLHKRLHHLLPTSTASLNITRRSFFSPSATKPTTQNSSPKPHFISQCLINLLRKRRQTRLKSSPHLRFSLEKANEALKHLTRVKSPSNPAVLQFFKHHGFTRTNIKHITSLHPTLLTANVDKTLKPNFQALQQLGFSPLSLTQLVLKNPNALLFLDPHHQIEFWRSDNLLEACKSNTGLTKIMRPSISLLKGSGLSNTQISKLLLNSSCFASSTSDMFETTIRKVQEIGVSPDSSRASFDAKSRLLQSLGWTEADVLSAFRKTPAVVNLSAKNIRRKMDFFVKEISCDLSYLVAHPQLLTYSLEKRYIPRHAVLKVLMRRKLLKQGSDLIPAFEVSHEQFIWKFILPYKKKIPGLYKAYLRACGRWKLGCSERYAMSTTTMR